MINSERSGSELLLFDFAGNRQFTLGLVKNYMFNFFPLFGFLFKFPKAIYDNWAHYEFSLCFVTDGSTCGIIIILYPEIDSTKMFVGK